jgi:uncharacterized membrane protein
MLFFPIFHAARITERSSVMKSINVARILTASVLVFAIANLLSAQDTTSGSRPKHPRYKLIDLGTLGGPVSYGSVNGEGNQILNASGVIASSADTSIPDPNAPDFCFNPECFVTHAVRWNHGIPTDLGALPGVNSSAASAINAGGWSVGQGGNGSFDPLIDVPVVTALLWKGEEIHDIGTLGGVWSLATGITNDGKVVGMATVDETPDTYGPLMCTALICSPFPSPTHPFVWKQGEMTDLGTLGGPDAAVAAGCVNQGLPVGGSFTSFTPDPSVGFPPVAPFAWINGVMKNLGSLGGSFGSAQCGNNRGQVIGTSSLAEYPFACLPESLVAIPFCGTEEFLEILERSEGIMEFPSGSMTPAIL